MSVHTADSQFSFQLPKLSYIDAKWEEPSLRRPDAVAPAARKTGLAAWLSRNVTAFLEWRRDRQAFAELSAMTGHELRDIGLTRADIGRAFTADLSEDLRQRGCR